MTRLALPAFVLLALAACGGEPPPEPEADAGERPSLEGNIFEDQVRALDRAKGVEQQLNESATRRLEEIDRMAAGEDENGNGS